MGTVLLRLESLLQLATTASVFQGLHLKLG
jgi:hypothetical protein